MKIFTHKTDAMRQLLNLVSRGHYQYAMGEVSPEKLEGLYLKFCDRYGVDRTPQQRWRGKSKGEASTHFVAWADDSKVAWWLLSTEGTGLVNELEKLNDAGNKKTRIELTGYELVKTPREGKSAQWSWRMTAQTYTQWKTRLKRVLRRDDDLELRRAIFTLKRSLGFSESRKQAFSLASLLKGDWERVKSTPWPYGEIYVGWFGKYQKGEEITPKELRKKALQKKK